MESMVSTRSHGIPLTETPSDHYKRTEYALELRTYLTKGRYKNQKTKGLAKLKRSHEYHRIYGRFPNHLKKIPVETGHGVLTDNQTPLSTQLGSTGVLFGSLEDGLQTSRDAILEFQSHNRAKPLRQLLGRTEDVTPSGLGGVPYRHKLIRDQQAHQVKHSDLNNEQTSKPLDHTSSGTSKLLHPFDDFLSDISSDDEESGDEEFDYSEIIVPGVSEPYRTDIDMGCLSGMDDSDKKGNHFLPVINLSSEFAQTGVYSQESLISTRRREVLLNGNPASRIRHPSKQVQTKGQTYPGDYITGRQYGEQTDSRASSKVPSLLSNNGSLLHGSDGSECYERNEFSQKHPKEQQLKHNYLRKKPFVLPLLTNENKKKPNISQKQNISLPKLPISSKDQHGTLQCMSNDDSGIQYNYHGTTSKLTKTKSYSLKDLTEFHKEKQNDSPQDTQWTTKQGRNRRVIDLSSYDNFARKTTRKYNTTKTMNMYMSKTGSPPSNPEGKDTKTLNGDTHSIYEHDEGEQNSKLACEVAELTKNDQERLEMTIHDRHSKLYHSDKSTISDSSVT